MNDLFWMITITDRHSTQKFTDFYQKYGVDITYCTVGRGTAASEILSFMGLDITEKVYIFTAVTGTVWRGIKYGLQNRMRIDVPGTGIAFIVPFSSVAGKKSLMFLTHGQDFVKGEEAALKDTKYELLIAIINKGYSDLVMDAARSAGAGGGTIIHAKGTGLKKAEQFMGMSLASEKELILTVVKSQQKNAIMKAVMENAGLETKAGAVVFSLPVTETAGMRLVEEDDEESALSAQGEPTNAV